MCSTQSVFVHFFPVDLNNYNLKPNSYTFYGGNFVCAHEKCCCLCSCSSLLIFTLLFASIYRFLSGAIKFSCCSSNELPLLCFFISRSRSSSFSVIHVSVDIKIESKKKRGFVVSSLLLKGWMAIRFTANTRSSLNANFHPSLQVTDGRTVR